MQAQRAAAPGHQVATQLGLDPAVYYRLEAGRRGPSPSTARILARWLGWTLEQVFDAAAQPPDEDIKAIGALAPPDDLHTLALRLPSGGVLKPWRTLGSSLVRDGVKALAVLVEPQVAVCRLAGLPYEDRELGRSLEERRDALDRWLVEQGAVVEASEAPPAST